MTRPLLTIVTITKNNCAGLGATYASLQSQSYQDYEWLICDGGSTDETLLFFDANELHDNIVSKSDTGIYNAMNMGLVRAQGDYILFLNAGDRLADPDILSLLATHIKSMPSDFIHGDAMEEDGNRFRIKKSKSHLSIQQGMFTHHQAMIYRRKILQALSFNTQYKVAGDYDLTLRYLKLCNDVSYIPAPLCVFGQGGISQARPLSGRNEEFRIKMKHSPERMTRHVIIYIRQTAAMSCKTLFPSLYWRLKSITA